jgi:CRP-like cAMP-binding protein
MGTTQSTTAAGDSGGGGCCATGGAQAAGSPRAAPRHAGSGASQPHGASVLPSNSPMVAAGRGTQPAGDAASDAVGLATPRGEPPTSNGGGGSSGDASPTPSQHSINDAADPNYRPTKSALYGLRRPKPDRRSSSSSSDDSSLGFGSDSGGGGSSKGPSLTHTPLAGGSSSGAGVMPPPAPLPPSSVDSRASSAQGTPPQQQLPPLSGSPVSPLLRAVSQRLGGGRAGTPELRGSAGRPPGSPLVRVLSGRAPGSRGSVRLSVSRRGPYGLSTMQRAEAGAEPDDESEHEWDAEDAEDFLAELGGGSAETSDHGGNTEAPPSTAAAAVDDDGAGIASGGPPQQPVLAAASGYDGTGALRTLPSLSTSSRSEGSLSPGSAAELLASGRPSSSAAPSAATGPLSSAADGGAPAAFAVSGLSLSSTGGSLPGAVVGQTNNTGVSTSSSASSTRYGGGGVSAQHTYVSVSPPAGPPSTGSGAATSPQLLVQHRASSVTLLPQSPEASRTGGGGTFTGTGSSGSGRTPASSPTSASGAAAAAAAAGSSLSYSSSDWVAMLQRVFDAAGLSRTQLDAVIARLRVAHFPNGSPIVRQGEEGDRFYIIEAGEVTVEEQRTPDDEPRVLTRLYPGNHFGEYSLLRQASRRMASVIARSPRGVTCRYLEKASFQELLAGDPSYGVVIQGLMAETEAMRQKREAAQRSGATTQATKVQFVQANASVAKITKTARRGVNDQRQETVNSYTLLKQLGSGSYGRVHLCQDEKDGGALGPDGKRRYFAIKVVDKQKLRRRRIGVSDAELLREVEVMKKLRHPNLVALHEVRDGECGV